MTSNNWDLVGSDDPQVAALAAQEIAEHAYACPDVVHVCPNMSYSFRAGVVTVEVNGGGLLGLFELLDTDPAPTDLWTVVESADHFPGHDKMHPASNRCVWLES